VAHPSKKMLKFLQARLSREGFLGLYLTLAILLLLAASWLFVVIAKDVVTGAQITVIDVRFSAWLEAHPVPLVVLLMRLVSELHSNWVIGIMTLALSAYWWIKGLRYRVLVFMSAAFGGMLLNEILKLLFLRPRPQFDHPYLTLTTHSFPSGHTMMATVFYGALAWVIWSRSNKWRWRFLAVAIPLIMMPLVGFSRVYLGAHYLSDVLGAMAEGAAWLTCCLIGAEVMKAQAKARHE
jgi:membrane-associated phospholipid phosphatase